MSDFKKLTALSKAAILGSLIACSPQRFENIPLNPMIQGPILENSKTTDTFVQDNGGNKVDILIINDNSPSMYEEQTKLGERFKSFISGIKDLDYQIAMTTTDVDSKEFGLQGSLMTWKGTGSIVLTPSTSNPEQAFLETVQRSETLNCNFDTGEGCASSNEQPLLQLIQSFGKRFSTNAGFFREGAPLVVVVLSDEDEMSTGVIGATPASAVINAFELAFGREKRLMFTGIVIKPEDTKCQEEQRRQSKGNGQGNFATRVAELAKLTRAELISICEKDYAQPLSEMSRLVRTLVTTFELRKEPRGGKASVKFTPALDIGYKLKGKKIVFDVPPPVGTIIEVSYDE